MQPTNRQARQAFFRKLPAWPLLAGLALHAAWNDETKAALDKHVTSFTANATFTVDTRSVHLAIHTIGDGATLGAGTYPKDATMEVHATPEADNVFAGWTGDLQATANPFTFILDKTVTLIAHFSKQGAQSTTGTQTGGSTGTDGQTTTGTDGQTTGTDGQTTTGTDGQTTTGTQGDGSSDSGTQSTTSQYVTSFTANETFTVDTRSLYLTIHTIGSGSALGAGAYPKNATVEVKATPEIDNLFTGWTGDLNATANHLVLTLDKSLTLFANFDALDQVSPFASTDLGSGWELSPWLGTVYLTDANWIYHATLGWIYVPELNDNDFWIWDGQLNWLWTNQQVYPFLYGNDINNWLYYNDSATTPRLFYNYADDSWMTVGE